MSKEKNIIKGKIQQKIDELTRDYEVSFEECVNKALKDAEEEFYFPGSMESKEEIQIRYIKNLIKEYGNRKITIFNEILRLRQVLSNIEEDYDIYSWLFDADPENALGYQPEDSPQLMYINGKIEFQ